MEAQSLLNNSRGLIETFYLSTNMMGLAPAVPEIWAEEKYLAFGHISGTAGARTMFMVVPTLLQKLFVKNGSHSFVRMLLGGTLASTAFIFYWAYTQLSVGIKTGEFPWYTIDIFFVSMSAFEVALCPFLGWVGFKRRRTMLMVVNLMLAVAGVLVLLLPDLDLGSGTKFCSFVDVASLLPNVAVRRLVLVTIMCLIGSLVAAVVWSHGIAYMDEHDANGMTLNYGIIVVFRVLSLLVVSKMLNHNSSRWFVAAGLFIGTAIQALQYLKVPEQAPVASNADSVPYDDRGLVVSLRRMMTNKLALAQIVAMAFLTAGLWGFAYHESDVVKVLYHTQFSSNWMASYADILRYHFLILAMVFAANKFSETPVVQFDQLKALKVATLVSLVLVPLYIALVTAFHCQRAEVAGLVGNNFTQPACSLACRCSAPYNDFSPVCLVENMQTYLSPCHAGCPRADDYSGVSAMTDCACGVMNRRATDGACGTATGDCGAAFELHKLVFLMIVIFFVIVIQTQGVLVLRLINPRDRSITLGLTSSVVSLVTFILGHMIFFGIRISTCAWFEGGQCQFHTSWFPYFIGAASASLTLVGFVINLGSLGWVGRKQARPLKPSEGTSLETPDQARSLSTPYET